MHLIISSGGTGGHFYPGLSIAREFVARGGRVTFLVSGQQVSEQKATAEKFGLAAREIPSVRVPHSLAELVKFPFRFWLCCRKIKALYRELQGDALLSMGSFTSVAPCWSWPKKSRPLFLHEGNTFMGQANRLFAAKAASIALSLPLTHPEQLKGTPSRIAGMPLREAILEAAANPPSAEERATILSGYGLSPEKRTLLVFGGSQGARAIVRLVTETLPLLASHAEKLQFIILTGTTENEALEDACRKAGIAARIVQRDPDIHRCYQVADAVLCRAGASSICELSLFGKAAMLVPLPSAKDNHQYFNAKCLADAGAAKLLGQSETTPRKLSETLEGWLTDPASWTAMGEAIHRFARLNATSDVVDMIQEFLEKSRLPKS